MSSVTDQLAARLQLGSASVLSPTKAAEMLPARKTNALRWLRERHLVREVRGLGEVVVWGEVVAAIVASDGPTVADLEEEPKAPSRRIPQLRRGSF